MKYNVVLGVTGGIAAYKACDIVSRLTKKEVNVDVIMTRSATEFVGPVTLQSLSKNKVVTDMFDTNFYWDIEHISLAKKADVFLIAPATANIIGKMANGIADDMLSTTLMATKSKIIMAPAMNTVMYESPAVQENIQKLMQRGVIFIEPLEGLLACNDIGKGKMQDPETIVDTVIHHLTLTNDLEGKKVLVTAGPTIEVIDPVRYITNRSSGKMGYQVAREAVRRGAKVTLISGKTSEKIPYGISEFISIESAEDMYQAVITRAAEMDIIIKSAAVADYTPSQKSQSKIKKSEGDMSIELERTHDILFETGQQKRKNQILVGFAAETDHILKNAISKMERKNLDLIVANDVKKEGAGFGVDTNIVNIIDRDGSVTELPLMDKSMVAKSLFDKIMELYDDSRDDRK
ncbi:bifunctional phosphopantothenoylcysteine decarboxylase/phosphopantothenate--cysteine ligase CoaBC [Proteocatella sphenisci]|uniref:bifunctional phosphopantothenoylcysteine decarboxylase/phosphopantothenate--cysteine ligase CoaBC n=1 Tax=Proteocatella sphenisci TaxID=181070 RepID=UPI00048C9DC5|nr:bifunctional phosphopantothenoylcysteine decarboxylase/phosphopantothenate--cysteine ligase CoaBC [Proteocatella sphenisci]